MKHTNIHFFFFQLNELIQIKNETRETKSQKEKEKKTKRKKNRKESGIIFSGSIGGIF